MLVKPNDIKPYEDETLERIQFEHLYIAMIILEAGIIISMLVFLGEMAWFARRLKKTGIEEAMTENIDMAEDNNNANEDDYTMDEKKIRRMEAMVQIFLRLFDCCSPLLDRCRLLSPPYSNPGGTRIDHHVTRGHKLETKFVNSKKNKGRRQNINNYNLTYLTLLF